MIEWYAFRALGLGRLMKLAKATPLSDFRNAYGPVDIFSKGFNYEGIGGN